MTSQHDLGELMRLRQENEALLLKLDLARGEIKDLSSRLHSVESERDNTRSMYDQEYAIVARIWKLYGMPSYDDLKGRSIYDLVKESIDRAQSSECRLDESEKARDNLRHFADQLAKQLGECLSLIEANGLKAGLSFVVEKRNISTGENNG